MREKDGMTPFLESITPITEDANRKEIEED